MARRRMIDPNFWQSEDISKLSLFARLLFIGMISNADDEGRGRANLSFLKSIIFPYDEVTTNEIEDALNEIQENTALVLYIVENSRYYTFSNWKKWQRVDKPQKSNIPSFQNGPFSETFQNDSGITPESNENDSGRKERKGIEKKEKEGRGKENAAHTYFGSFENVALTDEENKQIHDKYEQPCELINKISEYLANSKKEFSNHFALICKVAREDKWPKRKKERVDESISEPNKGTPMPKELREKMSRMFIP